MAILKITDIPVKELQKASNDNQYFIGYTASTFDKVKGRKMESVAKAIWSNEEEFKEILEFFEANKFIELVIPD